MRYQEFVTLTESKITEAEARIQHAEDLVFWEGARGALRAVNALRSLGSKTDQQVSLKFDGSPAVIFGRNQSGEFVLTDKSGFAAKGYDGKSTSGEDLENMLLSRSGGRNRDNPDYRKFAGRMRSIFDLYERAVPEDFRGYFKGDLLYFNTPSVQDGNYVFKPNVVEYAVDVNSDLGKKIGQSTSGVVIHRQMDLEGNEGPLEDADIFQGSEVLVVPPVYTESPAEVDTAQLDKLEQIVKQNAAKIDELLNPQTLRDNKMTDFPKLLYAYLNSKVDTGLDNLGNDFIQWLDSQAKLSDKKKENVKAYIGAHSAAFGTVWKVVQSIMKVKDAVVSQFDSQQKAIQQRMAGEKGGEGYVLAHPEGDIKLVPRQTFSRINRAIER